MKIKRLLTKTLVLHPNLTDNIDGDEHDIRFGIDFGFRDCYVVFVGRDPENPHIIHCENVKESIVDAQVVELFKLMGQYPRSDPPPPTPVADPAKKRKKG